MQFNGIKGHSFKLQEKDTLVELRFDPTTSSVSGAYVSTDNGITFNKLLNETEVSDKIKESIATISSGLQTPIPLALESDLPDLSSVIDYFAPNTWGVGDLVVYEGTVYECIIGGTESEFTPDNWSEVLSNGTYYSIQEMDVTAPGHTGRAWYNSGESINSWQTVYDATDKPLVEYSTLSSGDKVSKGTLVTYDKVIYRATTDVTCSANWTTDLASFEELKTSGAILNKFEPNRYYSANEMIIDNKTIYTRKTAGISGASLGDDIANWERHVELQSRGKRYVRFNTDSNTFSGPTVSSWKTLISYNYQEGDSGLLSGQYLVAPVDGLYYLDFNLGITLSTYTNSKSQVQIMQTPTDSGATSSVIAYDNVLDTSNAPSVYVLRHLKAGTKLYVSIHLSHSVSEYRNTVSEFGLISEDNSDDAVAEADVTTFTSTVKSTSTPLALENITNESILGTSGTITLPEDGVYLVHLDTYTSSSGGTSGFASVHLRTSDNNIIGDASYSAAANLQIPSLTSIVKGTKGETFSITYSKSVAQSGLGAPKVAPKVRIFKLKTSSVKISSSDLYNEYLDKLPEGSAPMTYDSWLRSLLQRNSMRVEAAFLTPVKPTTVASILTQNITYLNGDNTLLEDNFFKAPVSGLYYFRITPVQESSTAGHLKISLVKGTTISPDTIISSNQSGGFSSSKQKYNDSLDSIAWLDAGDKISVWLWSGDAECNYVTFPKIEFGLIQAGNPVGEYPNTWTPGVEYDLGNGLYGQRFTGSLTTGSTSSVKQVVIMSTAPKLIVDCGGTWIRHNNSGRWDYALGHVYWNSTLASFITSALCIDTDNNTMNLAFHSNNANEASTYDIWVKYTK